VTNWRPVAQIAEVNCPAATPRRSGTGCA
jgi:hypothetical protein